MAIPAIRTLLCHAACVAYATIYRALSSCHTLLVGDVSIILSHVERQTRVVHAHHQCHEVGVHTAVEPFEHTLQLIALVLNHDVLARNGEGVGSGSCSNRLEVVAVGCHLALAL